VEGDVVFASGRFAFATHKFRAQAYIRATDEMPHSLEDQAKAPV
jgi:hypothetical protein